MLVFQRIIKRRWPSAERDEHGRRLGVRNGSHQPREVLTSAGAVEVVAPRVNDRRSSAGLSASVITKLAETCKAEQRTFSQRDLSHVDYVYVSVRGRQARRTARRTPTTRSRLKDLHSQVLTIARRPTVDQLFLDRVQPALARVSSATSEASTVAESAAVMSVIGAASMIRT
ncbi:hypothetical protein WBK50_25515 [Pseudonocardia sp. T1-2H]|uniref:hypothetical protein n=1 Tax=Pseudonocardia sp. T1-2H TaxID=3128899 RepID=UPI003100DC18